MRSDSGRFGRSKIERPWKPQPLEVEWDHAEFARRYKRHQELIQGENMPIIAKASGSNFIPAPAGVHSAVCVDVVDLGMLEVNFGGKTKSQHKIRVVWQIDEDMEDGKPFICQRRYTLSLHEKASLRKDLESWRGKAFSPSELEGFDVETLIGVPCMLNVIHAPGQDGGTFANVTSIMRLAKGMQPARQRDYIRVCDRKPEDAQAPEQDFGHITDDDVPF